ncbi:hypothetical protein [Spiroplasma endosymbiont of Polydrusus pterygomalis]|uniref:hypothetical protein n=1 Tax=Spiroplasma endosymbiont of Polydrusus pterygomalis TaxID=3139327 RepID=UPI003CCB07C9
MKKQLSFLGALLLSSAVTASTTACNNPIVVAKDLKDVLTKTDLGVVSENHPGTIPTDFELKKKLNNFNLNLEIKGINIVNIDKDFAFVVGDGIFYKNDQIKITYQIATIDIRTRIVEGAYIDRFATTGQQPTREAVSARIHEYYHLDMSHLIIENITTESAIIKGDNILYTHQVTVKFSTNDSVDLSAIIIDKDLTVKTNGKDIPSNDDIITALHDTYQEKLNTDVIAIEIIGATNAIITSTNQKIYTGKVVVNLNLDIRIPLQDVINKGLDKIVIRSSKITVADVNQALAKQYPMLKMKEIEVTLQDNNAIIKSLNNNVYTGSYVVINNLLVDLSSVLTNKLPTFEIPGKNQPSQKQIMQALDTTNINLDVTKITIDNITDSSATIIGDGKFYSKDAIVVTYNCDKAELLSNVLKNKDLGPITTNGLDIPNIEQIMQAVKTKNTSVDVTKITIDKITDSSAIIIGDGITYKGTVAVSFTVNGNTINIKCLSYNHRETNSVGSIKTTWTSPDITLLSNWSDYAPDWDSFTNKFNKLSFGEQSYFHVYCNTYTDQKLSGSKLSVATNDISSDRNKNTLQLNYYYDKGFWGAFLQLDGYIHIWHDEKNVYLSINWSIDTIKCFRDRVWDINLQGAIFS